MPENTSPFPLDCDDSNVEVHPLADEVCDGVDTDCNGLIDDIEDGILLYQDADGDGYGDPSSPQTGCNELDGFVTLAGDCDDSDSMVNPTAFDYCNDGIDSNCDGIDNGLTAVCLLQMRRLSLTPMLGCIQAARFGVPVTLMEMGKRICWLAHGV